MGCCGPGAELTAMVLDARAGDQEVLLASRVVADGIRQTDLAVPAIHCGACVRTIEKALDGLAGVESARAKAPIIHPRGTSPPREVPGAAGWVYLIPNTFSRSGSNFGQIKTM